MIRSAVHGRDTSQSHKEGTDLYGRVHPNEARQLAPSLPPPPRQRGQPAVQPALVGGAAIGAGRVVMQPAWMVGDQDR